MAKIYEGSLKADGLRIGIAVSRFNSFITDKLLEGAVDGLTRNGMKGESIDIVKTPGSFELPLAVKNMAASKKYDAIICLGAVIKGDTPHYEYIAQEVAKGLASISLDYGVPVSFGVLTTDNIEQAIERSGTKSGNKGFDAALTAIEMGNLLIEYGKHGK